MAKFQSPLLGYNNNVRHRGRLFHVQTEDSGVNHPHIITHLFMDGGRILKSVKTSYAEHVGSDNMSETVRVLMKEQHKGMLIALRDGQFDGLVDPGKKPSGTMAAAGAPAEAKPAAPNPAEAKPPEAKPAEAKSPEPQPTPKKIAVEAPVPSAVKVSVDKAAPRHDVAIVDSQASPHTRPDPPRHLHVEESAPATIDEARRPAAVHQPQYVDPPLPPELEALLRDELPPLPEKQARPQRDADEEPKTTREPHRDGPEHHPSAHELTLDFDALERDAGGASHLFNQADLPPPPKNLFTKERGTGKYSAYKVDPQGDSARAPAARPQSATNQSPGPAQVRQGSPSPRPPPVQKSNEGRYAPARPAAIFGAPAKQAAPSIFSDDLLSDKSLDEVILSYLAEDLDPPRRK